MHESSMIGALLAKIEEVTRAAGASKVTKARVRVGVLAGISPSHFREHWETETVGSIAEGAELEVITRDDPRDADAQSVVLESIDVSE
jgi:hydrogenase nickel incorporation protein HypA/HybF